jgi:hypothetical protein
LSHIFNGTDAFEKSMPPISAPIMGIRTSSVKLFTILENALPMITPTAKSITFPLAMNCLNFNLVKKNTLRCNTLDFTNCFRNYPIIRSKAVEVTLFPNTFYIWGVTDQLNITLGEEIEDITSEYLF